MAAIDGTGWISQVGLQIADWVQLGRLEMSPDR